MPEIFSFYVLLYIDDSTLALGVKEFGQKLKRKLKDSGLNDSVKVLETGSLGLTGTGIIMTVYPDGVHYGNLKESDIDEIISEHF